jgi:hypothetical protein
LLVINHFSRVVPGKKNLSPIVLNLSNSINQLKSEVKILSTINRQLPSEVNFYHFGGVWSYIKFLKYNNKSSLNIPVFHGTDLHNYTRDLNFFNKLKAKFNYLANLELIRRSSFFYIVSGSLLQYVPNRYKHKSHILNLGVFMAPIHQVISMNIQKKVNLVAFVNNNSRGLKNIKLANEYCLNHDLEITEIVDLPYKQFLKKLAECQYLIITSLAEGSPNVLKEAILLGVTPIVVNVGDCKEIINRFGGILIDYSGKLIKIFNVNSDYDAEKYLSMDKTSNLLLNRIILTLNKYE